MPTLESAKAKWARKTAGKGPVWKAATEAAAPAACKGMAEFVGHPVPVWCEAQEAGVRAVSAEEFAAAITDKSEKWAAGMRRIK